MEVDTQDTFDPMNYWNKRYDDGYGSGPGSTGTAAERKADYVNAMIAEHDIETVLDVGCGDGQQLALLGIKPENYLGTDISMAAIRLSRKRHRDYRVVHRSKLRRDLRADLALSLDVVFHQLNDSDYLGHLADLFTRATKLVIIHSTNTEGAGAYHVRHRWFTPIVAMRYPAWELIEGASGRDTGKVQAFYAYRKATP